ncbi:MAG: redoxin [Rhodospirillaceae bacterium]|nr:redoxin [Rhodospirillaceae bacterium]
MTGLTWRRTVALLAGAPLLLPAVAARAAGPRKTFALHDAPRPMPEIAFAYEDGRQGRLADFRGRHVLLNIWATWCAPCRKEMPALDRLQELLGGEDFHVLPLSIDRAGIKVVRDFYARIGIRNLNIYIDQQAGIMRAMKLGGLPTTFLIDPEGRQIGALVGAAEWDAPELVGLFRERIAAVGRQGR